MLFGRCVCVSVCFVGTDHRVNRMVVVVVVPILSAGACACVSLYQ